MINITRFYKTLLDDVFYGIADDVFIQQPSPEKMMLSRIIRLNAVNLGLASRL